MFLSAQQEHDFAKRIEEVKPMFVEPRNKGSFAEVGNLCYVPVAHLQAIVMFKYLSELCLGVNFTFLG